MVRFDKRCMNLAGAVEYFREHLKVGDYLTEEGHAEMTWLGQGTERLGLTGACDLEEFSRLCQGQHLKTGDKLGVRDKGAHRRLCYFGQISAPKNVSIAYLVGGDGMLAVIPCARASMELASPDNRTVASVGIDDTGRPAYSIRVDGRKVLRPSPLGVVVDGVDSGQVAAISLA